MTGIRTARLMRALLHEDTFELFVSPAIADFQHTPSAAAYTAAWTSLVGALAQDMVDDLQILLDDAVLMIGLIAFQVCYYGGMLLLLVADVRTDEAIDLLAHGAAPRVAFTLLGIVLASALPTLLCFWPPRRTLDA